MKAVILAGGIALYCVAHPAAEAQNAQTGDYVEYENAVVREIISDSCEPDEISENHMRGEQKFTAEVLTGQYKGKLLLIEPAAEMFERVETEAAVYAKTGIRDLPHCAQRYRFLALNAMAAELCRLTERY